MFPSAIRLLVPVVLLTIGSLVGVGCDSSSGSKSGSSGQSVDGAGKWTSQPAQKESTTAQESPSPAKPGEGEGEGSAATPEVEIALDLPRPAFKGTPKHVPEGSHLEEPRVGPRAPFMAPKGTVNVALGQPVSGSDEDPIIGSLDLITDGDKEAREDSYVELGPGPQWIQIDLGDSAELHGMLLWQYHNNARVYHDVVVMLSDDPDFITGVTTVYNNDHDNSSSLGVGADKEYWESFEGRLFEFDPVTARYVRISTNGSTEDDQNHYTEVEVYGVPAK